MARYVHEIMNRELFSVKATTPATEALSHILGLGVSGAPVVDDNGKPLGMVALRDLIGDLTGVDASHCMHSPPVVVEADLLIQDAARLLGSTGLHRLIVVNEDGRAVGMLSSLDVIRGLIGMPATHPSAFPHFDRETGLVWTDDAELRVETIQDVAPDGPGVFALVRGGPYIPETIVWAESASNVRARLIELASAPQPFPVSRWLEGGRLRFRTTSVPKPEDRDHALEVLRARAKGGLR